MTERTVVIAQARMASTRLPGKVMKDIFGRPTVQWVVDAGIAAPGVNKVVVATSTNPENDVIQKWADDYGVSCFRGSETDVLSRVLGAALEHKADVIVRVTCDCPFLDPDVIGQVIHLRKIKGASYATNTDPPSYPDGLDVEVFTLAALETAAREATRSTDRDTVTRFLVRNRHRFPAANLVCPIPALVAERWVLDSPEDFAFITAVARRLHQGGIKTPSFLDILNILDKEPELRQLNATFSRNERFYEGLVQEEVHPRSYAVSQACLKRAEAIIPLGTQTFSKSKLMFPEGAAPLFVSHGDGGYVFDVDGNDYVDLVGGLLPNILGYRDPDVDEAIRDQLSRGISFSLATELEAELAEILSNHIPCADMVKFGKNGSDVTTAAVRLARHVTRREEVMVHGYHGWHTWTATNTNGITFNEKADSTHCTPDDLLTNHIDEFHPAAVMLEPEYFTVEQLKQIREACNRASSVLIFDEIITGFRCSLGGLQEITGVTPDLATFGKAMANGMPLSVLAGREPFMRAMPEILFSGTFFGETLSIAAAIATVKKLQREKVPSYLFELGLQIYDNVRLLISKYKVDSINLVASSPPQLNRIWYKDQDTQALFMEQMAENGVLIIGSHNTNFAHKEPEKRRILKAWAAALKAISRGAKPKGKIRGKSLR